MSADFVQKSSEEQTEVTSAEEIRVSVVIVNYNVREFLEQALLSLRNALADIPSEIIVVDNASVDGSIELIRERFPDIRLIANIS